MLFPSLQDPDRWTAEGSIADSSHDQNLAPSSQKYAIYACEPLTALVSVDLPVWGWLRLIVARSSGRLTPDSTTVARLLANNFRAISRRATPKPRHSPIRPRCLRTVNFILSRSPSLRTLSDRACTPKWRWTRGFHGLGPSFQEYRGTIFPISVDATDTCIVTQRGQDAPERLWKWARGPPFGWEDFPH